MGCPLQTEGLYNRLVGASDEHALYMTSYSFKSGKTDKMSVWSSLQPELWLHTLSALYYMNVLHWNRKYVAGSEVEAVYIGEIQLKRCSSAVSDSCFKNLAEDRSGVNLKDLVHDPSL